MRYLTIIFLTALLITLPACGGASDDNDQAPNSSQTSSVTIEYPRNGSIIYGETLHISGTAGENASTFRLSVADIEGNTLAETTLDAEAGTWNVELPHGYSGDPTEVTLKALPTTPDENTTAYDTRVILLTDISHRQEGVFGSLLFPTNGTQVGGEMLQVSGRISGTDAITVEWHDDSNTVRESLTVPVTNPNLLDDVPWQAELTFGNYTGQAIILAKVMDTDDNEIEIGEVRVTVTRAAG